MGISLLYLTYMCQWLICAMDNVRFKNSDRWRLISELTTCTPSRVSRFIAFPRLGPYNRGNLDLSPMLRHPTSELTEGVVSFLPDYTISIIYIALRQSQPPGVVLGRIYMNVEPNTFRKTEVYWPHVNFGLNFRFIPHISSWVDVHLTSASASFGVAPTSPVRRETCPSSMGSSLELSANSWCPQPNGWFSALQMHRIMELGVWGGGIRLMSMRAREGSSASIGCLDGISVSS